MGIIIIDGYPCERTQQPEGWAQALPVPASPLLPSLSMEVGTAALPTDTHRTLCDPSARWEGSG